ncbi:phage tail protein [Caballeronia sp. ATUFL_F1_KS4A]|uniref:phage tail protein n=1 Tax=Caballeronia sp. ATUFL_F1_KS4A TaxID=2921768 RepID=UPI0020289A02|nr:phage tail protein [Caballeronia sp. ATUFL_F1_KS4A]
MKDLVRSIRLYGSLGAKFGREHQYVVQSPREALRALGAMIPGFWQELYRSGSQGVRYAVFVGQRNVTEAELDLIGSAEPIRIAPVIAGSKVGGVLQTIAGVTLAAAGAASMFLAPGNPYGIDMMLMGGSLALGGIAQMLSPQTPTPPAKNYHGMPGIQNVSGQGGPVPLLYGTMRVGSNVISACMEAFDAPASAIPSEVHSAPMDDSSEPSEADLEDQKKTPINSRLAYTVVDLISEGEIAGLANDYGPIPADLIPFRSVYLNDIRVENDDASRNFEIEKFEFRNGTTGQGAVDWVSAAANEVHVGVELRRWLADGSKDGKATKITQSLPWVLEVAEPDVDEVDVTLQVSDLWWNSNKSHTNATVELRFEPSYAPAQDKPIEARKVEITGLSPIYHKTYRFPVDIVGAARFKLTIKRTDEIEQGKDAGLKHGAVHVMSYTKRRKGKFRYPSSALAAWRFDSTKFDRVPTRSYDVKGLLVEVPSNYDPHTRKYDGAWKGDFKRAWTDNPVWIFRDLLLNKRYGAGKWVQERMVERYALYAIARYCDERVPDGTGATEPRFTCNCYITSRSQAFALLQQLASVFRGIAYWSAEQVWGAADMPSDAVYVYNASNVVNGVFRYTGSSLKSRHTAAMVTWCDPNNGYKQAVESVEDADSIALYGYNVAEITAFGCTSRSQAQRAGHWLLQTARLETETVTFSVGLDGALALPGQVIEIADPLRTEICAGGRISEASNDRLLLDREVNAQEGDALTVVLPDARAQQAKLKQVRGASVELERSLVQAPVSGAAWTVQPASTNSRLYRVVSVSENDDGASFTITATQHSPEKYAAVDHSATTNEIDHAHIPVTPPSNLKIVPARGWGSGMSVIVSWAQAENAKQYVLEWIAPGGQASTMTLPSNKLEWRTGELKPGKYVARVQAEVWDGRRSERVETEILLQGLVYIKGMTPHRDRRVLTLDCHLESLIRGFEWYVEVRISKTEKFEDGLSVPGELNQSQVRFGRKGSGYVWARVRYGIPSQEGSRTHFAASAWYPSEHGPGIPFGAA